LIAWWWLIPAVMATAIVTYKLTQVSRDVDCKICQYNTAEAFGIVLARRAQFVKRVDG